MDTETFHLIKGRRRHGLIVDPGAASGIIGTDTLREYQDEVLSRHNKTVITRPSTSSFTGIDGKPTPGLGIAHIPLCHPLLPEAIFHADMIGGPGSCCPGLMPLKSMLNYKANLFTGTFDNGDGILQLNPRQSDGSRTPVLIRVLLTDSGHSLLPLDTDEIDDQSALRKHILQDMDPLVRHRHREQNQASANVILLEYDDTTPRTESRVE